MSKYWTERTWKNEGESGDRPEAKVRLQRIARESQEQDDAQIESWLKIADDFIGADAEPLPPDDDAGPEVA